MQQVKNPMSDDDKMQSLDTLHGKKIDFEKIGEGGVQELNDVEESLDEDTELTNQLNNILNKNQMKIQQIAQKRLRKHRRELKRLRILGEDALLKGNEEQYVYCVGKIRAIAGTTIPDDILRTMYKTSRERVLQMMSEAQSEVTE